MIIDNFYYRWSDSATRQSGGFGPTGDDAYGDHGLLPVKAQPPIKLGLIVNGQALFGTAAFNHLKQEGFILPSVPLDPPETLWQYTNPYVEETLPVLEKGDPLCPYGYELIKYSTGMHIQRATLQEALSLLNQGMADAWRIYDPLHDGETIQVPNPDYPAGHQAHVDAVAAYHQAVAQKLPVQFANYMFPTLKVGSTVKWYRKSEPEGVWPEGRWLRSHEIPMNPTHPLAGNGHPKAFYLQAREEDYYDFTEVINQSIWQTGDNRLKSILGII